MNFLHQLISAFHHCYEAFAGATTTTLLTAPPSFAKWLEISSSVHPEHLTVTIKLLILLFW